MAHREDLTADIEDEFIEVGEFVSEQNWEEVGPIMAALRQMEPEIKKWVKQAVCEAMIQFISDYEITVDEDKE